MATKSLARALTTRMRNKEEQPATVSPWIGRAASQRAPNAKPINTAKISLPVALLSTTNMLSYDAPDIADAPHVRQMGGRYFSSSTTSSSANSVSGDDSDHTGSVHSRETDATSIDLSSPDLNNDGFFKSASPERMTTASTISDVSEAPTVSDFDMQSPQIPQRAPSHSKKAHMLSHKRSVQRMRTEVAISRQNSVSHPFGRELEQLNEVAEEFGATVRSAETEADLAIMKAKGLVRFCANDYLDEISSAYSSIYEEDRHTYQPMVWI